MTLGGGWSLSGYVGPHRQGLPMLEVAHFVHINREDGSRETFSASATLPLGSAVEHVLAAYGEVSRRSLRAAIAGR